MAAEKNNKTLNVPNLRFPEFSGEWEKCTLGDITTNFSLRNKEQIKYPMYSVTNNRGFVPQSEQFEDREMMGEDIKAYKIIHEGDFAYNPARINVGSIAKYSKKDPCMISSLYVCFKAHSNIDKEWMMQLLKTPKMNFYYNVNGEGGVRVYLFYPNFARIRTSYPSLVEQQKIAAFLRLLDQRIETQKKIIEDLKKLKRAICKIVFSSPECVTIKMADMATITMGQSPSSLSYNEDRQGLPLIQGNLDLYDGKIRPRIYTSEITQTCTKGDIILTVRAPVGEIAHAQLAACIGRGVCAISPLNSSDAELIYQNLSYYKPTWAKLEQGSTFSSINGADIRGIEVQCPSMSKIMLLQLFDTRIQESINLLNAYSVSKCYLLSQLFI